MCVCVRVPDFFRKDTGFDTRTYVYTYIILYIYSPRWTQEMYPSLLDLQTSIFPKARQYIPASVHIPPSVQEVKR